MPSYQQDAEVMDGVFKVTLSCQLPAAAVVFVLVTVNLP